MNVHQPYGDYPQVNPETVALDYDSKLTRVSRGAKLAILLGVFALEGLWIAGMIWMVARIGGTLPP